MRPLLSALPLLSLPWLSCDPPGTVTVELAPGASTHTNFDSGRIAQVGAGARVANTIDLDRKSASLDGPSWDLRADPAGILHAFTHLVPLGAVASLDSIQDQPKSGWVKSAPLAPGHGYVVASDEGRFFRVTVSDATRNMHNVVIAWELKYGAMP